MIEIALIFLYQEPLSKICSLKGRADFGAEQVCKISSHSYDVVAHRFLN